MGEPAASMPGILSSAVQHPAGLNLRVRPADKTDRMDSKKTTREESAERKLRIFVRRGALRRFDRLKRDSQDLPVTINWDRRQEERRARGASPQADRRRSDRRKESPFTWDMADFVVAESTDDE